MYINSIYPLVFPQDPMEYPIMKHYTLWCHQTWMAGKSL